jgi:hypothetical protein
MRRRFYLVGYLEIFSTQSSILDVECSPSLLLPQLPSGLPGNQRHSFLQRFAVNYEGRAELVSVAGYAQQAQLSWDRRVEL